MYTPSYFSETDPARIASLIEANAFGVLISVVDGRASASHIPFLYDQTDGVLLGHLARANPQWKTLSSAQDVLVIFQGPHAYVSPSWYQGPGVPTWNYAVVHIHGEAATFDEPERLRTLVDALTGRYESSHSPPWSGFYDHRMLESIVGIEIRITDIQGKFKLSQNRSAEDRQSVCGHLRDGGLSEAERLARMMEDNEP